jgi:hypothetical protein
LHNASASADINASANVFTIACNRSGDPAASCAPNDPVAIRLVCGAAIVWFLLRIVDFAVSKDHAVAVSYLRITPIVGDSYTTSVDSTRGAEQLFGGNTEAIKEQASCRQFGRTSRIMRDAHFGILIWRATRSVRIMLAAAAGG